MFNRFLVAIDESDEALMAVTFASAAADHLDATVRVFRVDGGPHEVGGIVDEAERYDADVIVLGISRERAVGTHFARGVQQRLTEASSLPVVIAPDPRGGRPRV